MKRRSKKCAENLTLPHEIECAIRGIAHGSIACQKLATFLVEQQRPEFDAQGHLLIEAAGELRKALLWTERARNPVA